MCVRMRNKTNLFLKDIGFWASGDRRCRNESIDNVSCAKIRTLVQFPKLTQKRQVYYYRRTKNEKFPKNRGPGCLV